MIGFAAPMAGRKKAGGKSETAYAFVIPRRRYSERIPALVAQIERELKGQGNWLALSSIDRDEFLRVCIGLARDSRLNYDTGKEGVQDSGSDARKALEVLHRALLGTRRGGQPRRYRRVEERLAREAGDLDRRKMEAEEAIAFLRFKRLSRRGHFGAASDLWIRAQLAGF